MTTPEVKSQLTKNEPTDLVEGPVHPDQEAPAQGLLEKHRKLSVGSSEVCVPFNEDQTPSDASETEPRKDRVMSTGARTPNSLVAEIEARVAANEKDQNNKESSN